MAILRVYAKLDEYSVTALQYLKHRCDRGKPGHEFLIFGEIKSTLSIKSTA